MDGVSVRGFFLCCLAAIVLFPAHLFAETVDSSVPTDIQRDFDNLLIQLRKNPFHVPTLNSLGIVYARAGQINEAVELWKRGLALDPKYIHLYNNLGSALKSLKRDDEAREVFHRGLAIAPSYWIYYNLGLLEKDLGQTKEARKQFQNCLKMYPNFEPAMNQLAGMDQEQIVRNSPLSRPSQPTRSDHDCKPPVDFDNPCQMPAPWELPSKNGAPAMKDDSAPDIPAQSAAPAAPAIPEHPLSVDDVATALSKLSTGAGEKVVALTFDDGPHAELTPKLLDLLKAERVPATFFVIGSRGEVYPDILVRMAHEGHEIANHTWKHKSLVNQESAAALASLRQTATLIAGVTGRSCGLVRPPYGHTNSRVLAMIHSQGWQQIMWDVDTRDWQGGSTNRILARILRQFSPGSIILFHDIHTGALRSLPTLIAALKRSGYRFLTVSQLIGAINAAG